MSDLIAALATAPAPSAIGILRMSGPGAIHVLEQVFKATNGTPISQATPRTLVHGSLMDKQGRVIDKVLATIAVAPNSYTGEETAELQCHGSPLVLAMGLEALCAAGARPAQAGEFTQRAFLNGKLDLPQAEAVADLLDAQTHEAVLTAADQLTGTLSRRVAEVYDGLVNLMAHFHAVLDYPDEDIDAFRGEELEEVLETCTTTLKQLIASYDRGKYLSGGLPCAIVGLPNAGKSSLLNGLLGYDRAIVTDVAGTTRDTVEERCTVADVLLRLIDTAGLRDTDDVVEQLGVERSRTALEQAELALVLVDQNQEPCVEVDEVIALAEQRPKGILVLTKSDVGEGTFQPKTTLPVVSISSQTGDGMDKLADMIGQQVPKRVAGQMGAMLTNLRQAQSAQQALTALLAARDGYLMGITPDAVLTDVEGAMHALAELTGQTVREDVVSRIFSRFCVGK